MRSKWKGIYLNNIIYELFNFKLVNHITAFDIISKNAEKIEAYHSFDFIISNVRKIVFIDKFINTTFYIDEIDKKFKITNSMVGHRLGEFFETTIYTKFEKKNKKK